MGNPNENRAANPAEPSAVREFLSTPAELKTPSGLAFWLAVIGLVLFALCFGLLIPAVWQASELDIRAATLSRHLGEVEQLFDTAVARQRTAEEGAKSASEKLTVVDAELRERLVLVESAKADLSKSQSALADSEQAARDAKGASDRAEIMADLAATRQKDSDQRQQLMEQRIAQLETRERSLLAGIAVLDAQSPPLQRTVDQLKLTESTLRDRLVELNSQMSNYTQLREDAAALRGEVQGLESRREALNQTMQELSLSVSEAQKSSRSVEVLRAEIASLERQKAVAQAEATALERRAESLRDSISSTEAAEVAAIRLGEAYTALIRLVNDLASRAAPDVGENPIRTGPAPSAPPEGKP